MSTPTTPPKTTAARKVVDYVRAHPKAETAEIIKATGVKSKHTAIDWKRYAIAHPKPEPIDEEEVDQDEVDDDPKGEAPPVKPEQAADFDKELPAKKPDAAQKKKVEEEAKDQQARDREYTLTFW